MKMTERQLWVLLLSLMMAAVLASAQTQNVSSETQDETRKGKSNETLKKPLNLPKFVQSNIIIAAPKSWLLI
jgi:hypothetical protein